MTWWGLCLIIGGIGGLLGVIIWAALLILRSGYERDVAELECPYKVEWKKDEETLR